MRTPNTEIERLRIVPSHTYDSVSADNGSTEGRNQPGIHSWAPEVERWGEWLLLLVACTFLFAHTLPRAWETLNTDFPNYYLTAQLQREGFDVARAYEWRWLERQKEHHEIGLPIVGLVPITPFSTLAVWPLTGLSPLTAKHIWTLLQLALLLPITLALRRISGEPYRRIVLVIAACFPLHRNLEYGQYYILLLAMIVGACWAYQRQHSALAGSLVAIAAATKIFPILFLLYFLRKKDWRAISAALLTGVGAATVAIAAYGWSMHRTYLELVLPWTLRGEVLPPYTLASSSISTLLHRLFVYEPQWNAHPWHAAPALYAVLQPLLQMLVLAPALLLADPVRMHPRHIAMEWSALLTATLAISTVPASYNFTLLILPFIVLYGQLRSRHSAARWIVPLLFLGIGYPGWNTASVNGLDAVLHVPRLYLLLLLTATLYCSLLPPRPRSLQRSTLLWGAGLATLCLFSIFSTLKHQRGLYADYAYRIPERSDVLMASAPAMAQSSIARIVMLPGGYTLLGMPNAPYSATPELSFTASSAKGWVEQTRHNSRLEPIGQRDVAAIDQAHSPLLSADGQRLAYLRDVKGRSLLYVQSTNALHNPDTAWTPESMNVEEAAFLPDASLIVAVAEPRGGSQLYQFNSPMQGTLLNLRDARYPAASPDGRWLAYSTFSSGAWHLGLLNLASGTKRQLTDADCDQIEPSWEADSKTLLYASDCGRALWFTAICRRRVIQ